MLTLCHKSFLNMPPDYSYGYPFYRFMTVGAVFQHSESIILCYWEFPAQILLLLYRRRSSQTLRYHNDDGCDNLNNITKFSTKSFIFACFTYYLRV